MDADEILDEYVKLYEERKRLQQALAELMKNVSCPWTLNLFIRLLESDGVGIF